MLKPALRQCLKAARFLAPRLHELRLQRKIARSGQFDCAYYRGTNLRHRLTRLFPIRHYVLLGEHAGLSPRPGFIPHYYLSANRDVADASLRPLEHYIDAGQAEGRVTAPPAEVLLTPSAAFPIVRPTPRTAAHAVVVHIFYPDLWPEIAQTLKSLTLPFDLFVTITERGEDSDDLVHDIHRQFQGARVFRFPNHGRDIYPFVHLIEAGALEGYRAVAKLHTKKSPHRSDGHTWRQHLVQGILPGPRAANLLARFEADSSADVWVADGQVFEGSDWWGSNHRGVAALLARLELPFDPAQLRFPGGSIYWLKSNIVSLIRGMALTPEDFTHEGGQVDGTTAHAMERVIGYLAQAGGGRIVQTTEVAIAPASARPAPPRHVSAFYLPQFHPTPQNDAWWGEGYTEWQAVAAAKPNFEGHVQPQGPGVLGAYDLRVPETMGAQYALAQGAGVDAFCVYHYWFDGARLLETPLDGLLRRPDIPFGFYLCWANESWRRNWDGLSGEVLMPQSYAPGFEEGLVESTLPYMADPRYARPDGTRPRFVLYRPADMPDPSASVERMRAAWSRAGIDVELGAVLFHGEERKRLDPGDFEFLVEMPPHGCVKGQDFLVGGPCVGRFAPALIPRFKGLIYDYNAAALAACKPPKDISPEQVIPGIMPSWDNTPRRGRGAHIAYGANPARFRAWLAQTLEERVPQGYRQELFINSWNEWGECAAIEPSARYGAAYLDVLRTLCTSAKALETPQSKEVAA